MDKKQKDAMLKRLADKRQRKKATDPRRIIVDPPLTKRAD